MRAADEKQIVIDKIEFETMSPEKMGKSHGGGGASRDNKWTVVDISYTVYPDPNSKEKVSFLEGASFKVNVEGRDGEASDAQITILTGEVAYLMLPMGKGFASFYIPPEVVTRYRVGQFNVNVQALLGGQVIDSKDKKREKEENWFARSDYKILPGLVLTQNQSPFILNDTDRYPVIKPKQ